MEITKILFGHYVGKYGPWHLIPWYGIGPQQYDVVLAVLNSIVGCI